MLQLSRLVPWMVMPALQAVVRQLQSRRRIRRDRLMARRVLAVGGETPCGPGETQVWKCGPGRVWWCQGDT